ncbi:MAG: hypothetical protein LBL26_11195 [Peptococcaceae bacterium]|nr:hypothetical protein [Peptococcaceae bacterium]
MKTISTDELKRVTKSEGLILQGCGGDLDEWVAGINDLFTTEGILRDGDTFKDIAVFTHDGLTNMLFNMDGVKLDIGKLAMWRLQSHSTFGGTWLSDYLPNRLGVNMDEPLEQQKPECPIIGVDGNIFNVMGIAARTLKRNGMADAAREMQSRVTESGGYDNALAIIMEYVEPVEAGGHNQGSMEMR